MVVCLQSPLIWYRLSGRSVLAGGMSGERFTLTVTAPSSWAPLVIIGVAVRRDGDALHLEGPAHAVPAVAAALVGLPGMAAVAWESPEAFPSPPLYVNARGLQVAYNALALVFKWRRRHEAAHPESPT